ncbi:M23 family metallopeptidase [Streptomyces sp. NPDC051162]|uniref:M23 family metallopeptidase n=1 Tax=Streptomyces sp. NPDC051162 TaxID=3154747 RepID=UPI0034149B50
MGRLYRLLRISRGPSITRDRVLCVLCALCAVVWPLFGSGLPAAGGTPHRITRVTSEVFRLTEEAGEVKQRFERTRRAAGEQKARAEELDRMLRGREIVKAALRDDAGAAARAQYRTGGFTVEAGAEDVEDPVELLELQEPAVRRRAALGRLLDEDGRLAGKLAAERQSLAASRPLLEQDTARLKAAQHSLTTRLAAARDQLNAASQTSVASGRCEPLDVEDVGVGDTAERAAGDEHEEWTRPVLSYELSAGFGGAGANWANGHTGQDFAVPVGTPVRAVGAGTVVSTGCGGAFGMSLVIQHEGGWYSQYAHLSAALVAPGGQVRAGQWIGLAGTTGNSTGPHLHFEIRTTPEFGSAVDPVEWLNAHGVRV